MKRKKAKPARTTEQQAALDGWILLFLPKAIRGWNLIWVEEAQGGLGGEEEKALHP